MSPFRLYPVERPGPNGAPTWFSFADYGAVLDVMNSMLERPRHVLEFGPGSSTLALLEGGADVIDTCEDDPGWFTRHQADLAPYRNVTVHLYRHALPLVIPLLDGRRYDLGLVDGPVNPRHRQPEIDYALSRCTAVLCHDAAHPMVARTLGRSMLPIRLVGERFALVVRP